MNKIVIMLHVLVCVVFISGCGTIQGIGEDITSLGGFISDGSDHYKEAVEANPPGSKMETKSE